MHRQEADLRPHISLHAEVVQYAAWSRAAEASASSVDVDFDGTLLKVQLGDSQAVPFAVRQPRELLVGAASPGHARVTCAAVQADVAWRPLARRGQCEACL